MPRKPLVGLADCPECGFPDAECREDRNGRLYRWCPDCGVQVFARTAEQDQRMRAKVRAVAPRAQAPAQVPEPAPALDQPPPPPADKPRRVGTLLD